MEHLEQAFLAHIARGGGKIYHKRTCEQGTYIYATFPLSAILQPEDRIKGGVGLRLSHGQAVLSTFLLRQVRDNGIVAPYWYQDGFSPIASPKALLPALEATFGWIREKGLVRIANQYRRAMRRPVDAAFWQQLSQSLERAAPGHYLMPSVKIAARIEALQNFSYARLLKQRRQDINSLTLFDVVNGLTAVAREQKNAALRWKLEQMAWTSLFSQESTTKPRMKRPVAAKGVAMRM